MPKTYWKSDQVCEYLGINPNNLRQVTHRHKKLHEEMGCKGSCLHVVPSYGGGSNGNWYDADAIKNYKLVRKQNTNPNALKERKEIKSNRKYDTNRKAKR